MNKQATHCVANSCLIYHAVSGKSGRQYGPNLLISEKTLKLERACRCIEVLKNTARGGSPHVHNFCGKSCG